MWNKNNIFFIIAFTLIGLISLSILYPTLRKEMENKNSYDELHSYSGVDIGNMSNEGLNPDDNNYAEHAYLGGSARLVPSSHFLVRMENEKAIIYLDKSTYGGGDFKFYDYASLDVNQMNKEEQDRLKNGIYFEDVMGLYEFLQSYSS